MKLTSPRQRSSPSHVVEVMDDSHCEVMAHLERLLALVPLLDTAPQDEAACTRARELIDFFTGPSREHNYDEERHVFPSLLAGGDAEMHQTVERLREDHAWIELHWLDIESQLAASTQGKVPGDLIALAAAAANFAAIVREHMALEESVIYPQLRMRISAVAGAFQGDVAAGRVREH